MPPITTVAVSPISSQAMVASYNLDVHSGFHFPPAYTHSLLPPSPTDIDASPSSYPSTSDASLRVRKPRRQFLSPYHYPSSASLNTPASVIQQHTPIVIPSNVYAPQTLPLHSPQPMNGYSPLSTLSDASVSAGLCTIKSDASSSLLEFSTSALPSYTLAEEPLSNTFPTPSELLSELNQRAAAAPKEPGKKTKKRKSQPDISNIDNGYTPTDPDSISSHDKKRYYLDCIEQYVLYLHEQLRLAGVEPVPLERVSSGRGLNSRSIRTMLVHMQKTASSLSRKRQEAEERLKGPPLRRHSIAHPGPAPSFSFP